MHVHQLLLAAVITTAVNASTPEGCYALRATPSIVAQSPQISPNDCVGWCGASPFALIGPTPSNPSMFYCACSKAWPAPADSSNSCTFACPLGGVPWYTPVCGGYDTGAGFIAWSLYYAGGPIPPKPAAAPVPVKPIPAPQPQPPPPPPPAPAPAPPAPAPIPAPPVVPAPGGNNAPPAPQPVIPQQGGSNQNQPVVPPTSNQPSIGNTQQDGSAAINSNNNNAGGATNNNNSGSTLLEVTLFDQTNPISSDVSSIALPAAAGAGAGVVVGQVQRPGSGTGVSGLPPPTTSQSAGQQNLTLFIGGGVAGVIAVLAVGFVVVTRHRRRRATCSGGGVGDDSLSTVDDIVGNYQEEADDKGGVEDAFDIDLYRRMTPPPPRSPIPLPPLARVSSVRSQRNGVRSHPRRQDSVASSVRGTV
ncbi:hypothetical protein BDR26DRAFT_894997 [Obelidium mucronatum]|nr:hypothetical protein BDR26DRAFT_894997 [Obelidium mucronatum]